VGLTRDAASATIEEQSALLLRRHGEQLVQVRHPFPVTRPDVRPLTRPRHTQLITIDATTGGESHLRSTALVSLGDLLSVSPALHSFFLDIFAKRDTLAHLLAELRRCDERLSSTALQPMEELAHLLLYNGVCSVLVQVASSPTGR
jgi:hypothetical protein